MCKKKALRRTPGEILSFTYWILILASRLDSQSSRPSFLQAGASCAAIV